MVRLCVSVSAPSCRYHASAQGELQRMDITAMSGPARIERFSPQNIAGNIGTHKKTVCRVNPGMAANEKTIVWRLAYGTATFRSGVAANGFFPYQVSLHIEPDKVDIGIIIGLPCHDEPIAGCLAYAIRPVIYFAAAKSPCPLSVAGSVCADHICIRPSGAE